MDKQEITLIKLAQDGNKKAFEDLVKKHDSKVLQIAFSILGNQQDAQDVYQETFIRVFINITNFKFQSSFSTWVIRIVINQSINHYRKKYFKQKLSPFEQDKEYIDNLCDHHASPEDKLVSLEILKQVEKSMNILSVKERTVFILKHYHDYKLKEIAEMMNCKEGTVKNYLFRATQKLRKKLKSYYES
jgi:RNA polymerase sigma-70 factor (ECF subfamily)